MRTIGAPLGIEFGKLELLSNSHIALEAGEFAKDYGKYEVFSEKLFKACHTDTLDIGNLEIILNVVSELGLHKEKLAQALEEEHYTSRLQQIQKEAEAYEVHTTPTFIINNEFKIEGVQPIEAFRNILQGIEKEDK